MPAPIDPFVSVIIPVRNGLPLIQKVLERLANQEFDQSFEVIVIDSGSDDGTPDCVRAMDRRFRLIEIPPHEFGHGRTRNLGLSESRAELCAFLTHDAVPLGTRWLHEITKPLRNDTRIAGVFGRHVAHDDADVFTKWEIDTHFAGLADWPVIQITDWERYRTDEGYRQIHHFYSNNASCMRRSVSKYFPFKDVDFGEDQVWAKQVIEAGMRKAYAENAVVAHSHNFSLFERVQRSYDESRMFRTRFGYHLCPTLRNLLTQARTLNQRDMKLARANNWFKSDLYSVLRRFVDNYARQCGLYLGGRPPEFHARYGPWLNGDKYKKERTRE